MPEIDPRFIREAEPARQDGEALQLSGDEERSLRLDRRREEIAGLTQDRTQRKKYANRLFWLVVGWLLVVGAILLLHGFAVAAFELPGIALTTLIGSTTASVIGLFAIVANYLFPRQ